MRRKVIPALAIALGLGVTPAALGTPAQPAQAGPEYGLLVSAIAGGMQATTPIYTCPGLDLTPIAQAFGGPQAVQKIGLELVAQSLGTRQKPWPRNHRAVTYRGRRWIPDFVRGTTLFLVDTGRPLNLAEIRDLQAVARRRGGQLVVVTRRSAAISPALSKAASRWWKRSAGRVRVLRCI